MSQFTDDYDAAADDDDDYAKDFKANKRIFLNIP